MNEEHFLMKNVVASIDEKSKGTILRSMAIFTAIELCGSFLRGKTGSGTTKPNFLAFCKSKYMPTDYVTLAELLYFIFGEIGDGGNRGCPLDYWFTGLDAGTG
jgi:hypothetical protein